MASSKYPHTHISDLITLVKNATDIIESHYSKSSLPIVPSLDSLTLHPLDSTISPPQLRDAVQILEGASAQLCATLARPSHTMLNRALQFFEPACLSVVTTFKIPDILQEQPSGMHIKEIGKRAGVNHEKLSGIMRLLATDHIFREVATDCFANNRLSLQLLSSNPMASMVSWFTGELSAVTSMLVDVLADPEWGNSEAHGRSRGTGPKGFTALSISIMKGYVHFFLRDLASDEAHAQFQVTSDGAKQGALLGIGLRGWNDAVQSTSGLLDFPWEQYPSGTTVNEVGGGVGYVSMELIKAYPNLQLKLQDLPERIRQAETEVWPELLPTAITEKRIEFKAMDFFVDSPIEGCDVYYLKYIIHDWPDKDCIQILRNIRAVLKPGARILIHDYVLHHANRTNTSNSELKEAPEPILPNYGAGRIREYNVGMIVLVITNGRERTLEEVIDIANKADLRFVKFWPTGEMGMIELESA